MFDEDPEGKHIFGTVRVGERGQIVIPKKAREIFSIQPGDTLLIVGDEKRGIAIVKTDTFKAMAKRLFCIFDQEPGEDPED